MRPSFLGYTAYDSPPPFPKAGDDEYKGPPLPDVVPVSDFMVADKSPDDIDDDDDEEEEDGGAGDEVDDGALLGSDDVKRPLNGFEGDDHEEEDDDTTTGIADDTDPDPVAPHIEAFIPIYVKR